mgnify:CR=1 FL=1
MLFLINFQIYLVFWQRLFRLLSRSYNVNKIEQKKEKKENFSHVIVDLHQQRSKRLLRMIEGLFECKKLGLRSGSSYPETIQALNGLQPPVTTVYVLQPAQLLVFNFLIYILSLLVSSFHSCRCMLFPTYYEVMAARQNATVRESACVL